jgi:hypothetical protein
MKVTTHDTSQSPAVKLALVAFAVVAVVSDVPAVEFGMYSPIAPALALLFVGVPVMPTVETGVIAPVAIVRPPVTPTPPDETVSAGVVTVPVNVGDASGAAPKVVNAAPADALPVPPFAIGSGSATKE